MKNFTDTGYRIDGRYRPRRFNGFTLTLWEGLCDDAFIGLCCRIAENADVVCTRIHSSPFARVHRFEYQKKIYYHKVFLPRSRWEPVKEIFKGTRAQRTLQGHLLLEKNGFNTPRVVAVGDKGPLNFMVAEAMTDERGGRRYWQETFPSGSPTAAKRLFIGHIGHAVGKLHAAGIFHGDLRLNNMGIDDRQPERWRFELIDNERTVQYRRLPGARRIKNLVQLHISTARLTSRTDRLRFVEAYLSENRELRRHKKKWIRHVLQHLSQRLAKKGRKGNRCPG